MIERYFVHTVTVVNPGASEDEDIYGDAIVSDDEGVDYPARVGQLSTEELLINRDTTVSRYSLRLPLTAVITARSSVLWKGNRYRVAGEPALMEKPRGGTSHVRAIIERAED